MVFDNIIIIIKHTYWLYGCTSIDIIHIKRPFSGPQMCSIDIIQIVYNRLDENVDK